MTAPEATEATTEDAGKVAESPPRDPRAPPLSRHDRQYLSRILWRVRSAIDTRTVAAHSSERERALALLDAGISKLQHEDVVSRDSVERTLLVAYAGLKSVEKSDDLRTLVKGAVWRYFKKTL